MFFFGSAMPKSNAHAHLKQRKKHSGLIEAVWELVIINMQNNFEHDIWKTSIQIKTRLKRRK